MKIYNFFDLSRDQLVDVSRDFVGLILNHHPARFGVLRPNGTENNDVCSISSNSNSISSAEVPMPRFTNGPFKSKKLLQIFCRCLRESIIVKVFTHNANN